MSNKKSPRKPPFKKQQVWLTDGQMSRTLQDLEGEDWGDGDFFPSHLVMTCHRLRRKALRDFTIEDLRIMIGQRFSLLYLLPLAIERLREDPLASGDYYDGDLLVQVLTVPATWWQAHPKWWLTLHDIIRDLELPARSPQIPAAIAAFEAAQRSRHA